MDVTNGILDWLKSLSSWRAWIEIPYERVHDQFCRRSPHGERGLKSEDALLTAFDGEVALLMESVD